MSVTRAAIRYAKAILEIATSKNVSAQVSVDLDLVHATIESNPDLNTFIHSPTISVEQKENALLEVFANSNPVTKSLFRLLKENKRFEILDHVALEYSKLFDEVNGIEVAEVTTAFKMDADLENKVLAKIATFSNKKISIKNIIDPSILGGFVLRIGDKQYNGSVASRLRVLKRELSN